MDENKHIKCDVFDCAFNNESCVHCSLDHIMVSNCSNKKEKEATMCASYQKKEDE